MNFPDFNDCVYFVKKEKLKEIIEVFKIQELLSKDLHEKNFKIEFRKKSEDDKGKFFKYLFKSLYYMEQKGIVHNDIKPPNIILNKKGEIKIIDFGMAGLLGEETNHVTNCFDFPKSKNRDSPKHFNRSVCKRINYGK